MERGGGTVPTPRKKRAPAALVHKMDEESGHQQEKIEANSKDMTLKVEAHRDGRKLVVMVRKATDLMRGSWRVSGA